MSRIFTLPQARLIAAALAGLLPFWHNATVGAATPPTPEAVEFFEREVRPVLVRNCLECHGEKQKGGLRLDSPGAMKKGGDSGRLISLGNPDDSLLIQAVRYTNEIKMPPEARLAPEAVEALTHWVKQGASWPAGAGHFAATNSTAGNLIGRFSRSRNRSYPKWRGATGFERPSIASWRADSKSTASRRRLRLIAPP